MDDKYLIRVYIFSKEMELIFTDAIFVGLFSVTQEFNGANSCLKIYDGKTSHNGLKCLISLGFKYFPLNNYGDFIIKCPNCGERIDDDMILNVYDENILSGYNISCNRKDCGTQMANVEFVG